MTFSIKSLHRHLGVSLLTGTLCIGTGAFGGDFYLDWTQQAWTDGERGPFIVTLQDQYGFTSDIQMFYGGQGAYIDSAPSRFITRDFGGGIPSLALSADASLDLGGYRQSRVNAVLFFFSQGIALPVNELNYQVYSIDPQDNNSSTDHCDAVFIQEPVTVTSENLFPTHTIATGVRGGGRGRGGAILSTEIRCIYDPVLGQAPSSLNTDKGTVNVVHPNGTTEVRLQYDDVIDVVNPTPLSPNDPSARSIGIWGDLSYSVPQTISLTKETDFIGIADQGDVIEYTYTVTNTGPLPITASQDIVVKDDKIPLVNCPAVTTDIAPGDSVVCTATYTVTRDDVENLTLTNIARAGVGTVGQPFADRLQSQAQSVTVITSRGVDRGDAPLSFLQATHGISANPTLFMGNIAPDADAIPRGGIASTGDDLAGVDDEDGVLIPQMTQGVVSTIVVDVTGPGYLSAWADFDGGGLFVEGTIEQVAQDLRDDGTGADQVAGDGKIEVAVLVPETALAAQSYARFRWSSDQGLGPSGFASDGEVEDYTFVVLAPNLVDRGDAPASFGDASHYTTPSIYLGATAPDAEALPQYSGDASADDLKGTDDDDDISFSTSLVAGQVTRVTIETHETLGLLLDAPLPPIGLVGVTNLQMFVDFDNNGSFSVDEHIATNFRDGGTGDVDGSFNNSISFDINVPSDAVGGPTIMRLRWSTTSGLTTNPFEGQSLDGEVSDFSVPIQPLGGAISGTLYEDTNRSNTLDVGEIGLGAGIEITLYDQAGTVNDPSDDIYITATDTDANGVYRFEALSPLLTYRVELDANDPNIQQNLTLGSLNPITGVTVIAATETPGQDFAFNLAQTQLSGVVFLDNGGQAHDGMKTPDEVGAGFANLELFNDTGVSLGNADIGADGRWAYALASDYSGAITLKVTPNFGYLNISENTGMAPNLINPSQYDGMFTFTPDVAVPYDELNFGLIARPSLSQNQTVAATTEQAVFVRHTYRAPSSGDVTFAFENQGDASLTLFGDVACNGVADSAYAGAVSVQRGQNVCVMVRVVSSKTTSYDLVAETRFANTSLTSREVNTDTVSVSGPSGHLQVSKTVRNISQGTAEGATNAGQIGDVLEYRIYLNNNSTADVSNVFVHDKTPPYTRTSDPIITPVVLSSGQSCVLVTPQNNIAGYSGPLKWECTGDFKPGAQGSVGFQVAIQP